MSPTKKRKLQSDLSDLPEAFLSEVIEEVDTEIALKQQLTETLEARIAWALLLQESIKNPRGNASSASEYAFRNDALEALSWGERNSQFILQGDPTPPPPTAVDPNRTIRAAARKQAQAYPTTLKPKPSFLYTRVHVHAHAHPQGDAPSAEKKSTYVLRCPECSRTAFTSLQGLLNHARLAHNLEWGTHENCIRSCAVLDNDLDVDAGIEVSSAPVGIPALRDLFQRAVGSSGDVPRDLATTRRPSGGLGTSGDRISGEEHLVKTLGFHGESPALAPYLGKERTRRAIKVWDEDGDVVDVVDGFGNVGKGGDGGGDEHRRLARWKMPFTPRNFVENAMPESGPAEEDIVSKSEQERDANQMHDGGQMGGVTESVVAGQSRFHLVARIVITDRSLWIPLEKRAKDAQKYSHKWMISVDAPAYTRHITCVLNSIKVSPSDITVDAPSTGTTSNPPFVVIGFANRPFLAKIELSFSGTSSFQRESRISEQKVAFEHWVDLDPLEHRDPYDGQDQVLDVELDKNTILKPPQLKYTPIRSKSLWDKVTLSSILDSQEEAPRIEEAEEENKKEDGPEPEMEDQTEEYPNRTMPELPADVLSVLNRCAKQFPMILPSTRTLNRPQSSAIQYRPVPSREYFDTLVLGRRKAIEWARALAVRNAYMEDMHNLKRPKFIPLTVANVYWWMSQNGHFIREARTVKKDTIPPRAESDGPIFQWCPICGLEADLHRMTKVVKMEHLEDEGEARGSGTESYRADATLMSDRGCHIVPSVLQIAKLPRINLAGLSLDYDPPAIPLPHVKSYLALNGGSLVAAADPRLILSIHNMVEGLMLSKYPSSTNRHENVVLYPIDALGEHRRDVENTLSVPALLAHLTKQFLRVLIKGGLEVAKRDKITASGMMFPSAASQRGNRSASRKILKSSQLLTPTHILSGVLTRGRGRGRGSSRSAMDTVVLSSLSNMGVTVEYDDQLAPSRQGEGESRVKLED